MYKAGLSYSREKSKPFGVIKIVDTTLYDRNMVLAQKVQYYTLPCTGWVPVILNIILNINCRVDYIPINEWPKGGIFKKNHILVVCYFRYIIFQLFAIHCLKHSLNKTQL